MRGLSGKSIVVAGGARNIGRATARRLAAHGARVVVGDIDGAGAEETATLIRADGGDAVAAVYDAADAATVQALADLALKTFGQLDGWHNNAADTTDETVGVDLESDATTVPLDVWHRTFAVNIEGYLHGVRAAVPLLLARGGGSIVHTASDGAFGTLANLSAYTAGKAAVFALSRHVASRWGRAGIRSNVVSPGKILSDEMLETTNEEELAALAPAHSPRAGLPDDIAAAVAFLLSDDAAYVNGQVLSVNGGSLMR